MFKWTWSRKGKKSFVVNAQRLNRCICGGTEIDLIPNGLQNGMKAWSAMCRNCGETVIEHRSNRRGIRFFRDAWNSHMRYRQPREGGQINDTRTDEEG